MPDLDHAYASSGDVDHSADVLALVVDWVLEPTKRRSVVVHRFPGR